MGRQALNTIMNISLVVGLRHGRHRRDMVKAQWSVVRHEVNIID